MSGAIGGAIISTIVGLVLESTGSYIPIFAMFSVAYVSAWLVLKIGIRKIEPIAL